jgi:hypothetical protein
VLFESRATVMPVFQVQQPEPETDSPAFRSSTGRAHRGTASDRDPGTGELRRDQNYATVTGTQAGTETQAGGGRGGRALSPSPSPVTQTRD